MVRLESSKSTSLKRLERADEARIGLRFAVFQGKFLPKVLLLSTFFKVYAAEAFFAP